MFPILLATLFSFQLIIILFNEISQVRSSRRPFFYYCVIVLLL